MKRRRTIDQNQGQDEKRFESRTSIGARSDVGAGVGPGMGSSVGPSVGAGIGPSMGPGGGSLGPELGQGVDIGPGEGSHITPSSGAPSVGQGGSEGRTGSLGQLPPEETARDRGQDLGRNQRGANAIGEGGGEASGSDEEQSLGDKVKSKVQDLADKVKKVA